MRTLKKSVIRGMGEIVAIIGILFCASSIFSIKKVQQSQLTYDDNKMIYQGDVVNHRMNGYGELTFENGDTYKGNFINGVFDGEGIYQSNEGWVYKGDFKAGQADGQGTLITEKRATYSGTFSKGIYQQ